MKYDYYHHTWQWARSKQLCEGEETKTCCAFVNKPVCIMTDHTNRSNSHFTSIKITFLHNEDFARCRQWLLMLKQQSWCTGVKWTTVHCNLSTFSYFQQQYLKKKYISYFACFVYRRMKLNTELKCIWQVWHQLVCWTTNCNLV